MGEESEAIQVLQHAIHVVFSGENMPSLLSGCDSKKGAYLLLFEDMNAVKTASPAKRSFLPFSHIKSVLSVYGLPPLSPIPVGENIVAVVAVICSFHLSRTPTVVAALQHQFLLGLDGEGHPKVTLAPV